MKNTLLIASAIALCGSVADAQVRRAPARPAAKAAPAKVPQKPAFEFKEAKAGVTMDPSTVGNCKPDEDGIAGKVKCAGKDGTIAGVKLLLAPTYSFYNGRLTNMLYLFDAKGTDFLTFLSAFREKYGAPCHSETKKWQSRGGANYDNQTAEWCFATGKLELESLGPSLEYGLVSYDDDYSGPSKDTPKDF